MKQILKPQYIKTLYQSFRLLPPFDSYNLPPASKIKFKIIESKEAYGYFDCEPLVIEISTLCTSFELVMETLLHEMVHLHLYLDGKTHYERHDKTFKKIAAKVCKIYGFDIKRF